MSLKVIVHSASNLPNVDLIGLSDPFVVLSFRGSKKSTSVQKDTLNPEWEAKDATCEWSLEAGQLKQNDKLSVKVKDYEPAWFQKLLGQVEIPLHELRKNGKEIKKQYYELEDGKHRPTIGTVCLDIEYVPPGGRDRENEEQIGGDETDGDEDHDDEENQEDEDEHDHDKGDEKRSIRVKNRMPRTRIARKWSDKIKDFQIRIHIFEGRQIPGTNIHPMVRVTVAGKRKQTSTKQSTNNPIYNDEMLSFIFRKSEAELFDEPIILEVFNARGPFRSNALLGYFKFDIGFVHERKGHSFIRKWIMLSKPVGKKEKESVSLGRKHSPAGYLKVTAVVQGSGDKLPVEVDVPTVEDKEEDIEENCLTPVGLHRQSAVFVLNVYQANDLPQMDAGVLTKFKRFFTGLPLLSKRSEEIPQAKEDLEEEQNLVDPYLIFSFAGNQVSTDVEYKNSNPKFRQVLTIPFLFPSMCERLKLQLKDWDQGNKNDFIGTAYLHLSAISGQGGLGEGFLPQFGPSYINFYGSPREYHKTTDKFEHLNKGIGEGVAYRGRLLVELKTIPTQGTARPTRKAMKKQDEITVERFKKCSKFTLFACFHEATMIAVTDGSVEFEISMGNKGTKFDESVAPSNTTPCKPVYDHSHYHYLSWGGEKPCVWIECSWEDISFRIEPLNILTNMRKKLESDLEELQKGKKTMKSVLEVFSETCWMELIRFRNETIKFKGRSQRNSLDKELHDLRKTELETLMTEAKNLSEKPEDELDMETVIEEIKNYIKRIRSMAKEPQLSMPDVILWMISDNKRVAYYRIPAHHLLFSENEAACGRFCGKTIELRFKYPGRDAEETQIPALVRLELWLGLATQQQHWINRESGEFNVYAETYENEMRKKSTWSPSTSGTWPHFSDVSGSLELPKKSFTEPEGWKFSGDWMTSRGDLTTIRHLEESLTEFLDEVYEHEARRIPGGDWKPDKPRYVDSYGEETTLTPDPPKGWIKTTDWSVDLNCAVDDEGWQYSKHRSYYEYGPEEKAFDMSRRRRLIRPRRRDLNATVKQVHADPKPTDEWEYAQSFHKNFHPDERKTDCLRRRRWLHKIVPEAAKKGSSIKFPVFKVLVQGLLGKESALCVIPRMLVTYPTTKCQLWVSIYQARGLIAQDNTGMNDPYVRVTFSYQSQVTETLTQTLSPTWDQTLVFKEVDMFGNPRDLVENPPSVVMEVIDYDKSVHDFLGRCIFKPKVRIEGNDEPKLEWRKLRRGDQDAGQILVECELFLAPQIEGSQLPALPKPRGRVYPVRPGVAPEKQRKAIEILSWGVRNMKGRNLLFGPNISVEFECNQAIFKSGEVIKDEARCPNFSRPVLERKVLELPSNVEYSPPINILVFNSMFGKSPVGLHEIQSLKEFEVHTAESQSHDDCIERPPTERKRKKSAESDQETAAFETQEVFDWWSKYDASLFEDANAAEDKESELSSKDKRKHEGPMTHVEKYLARGYDTLKFYHCKLEDVPGFNGFNDFVRTFPLRKGKTKSSKDSEAVVGQFKGAFRLIDDPDSSSNTMTTMHLRPSKPIDCVVRVYVIRANHLQPNDPDGLADPYLIVSLGDTKYDTRDERVPETLNPIFGSMFKFKAKIPTVKDLKIKVMDHDYVYAGTDDLIGETVIDLEQRLLSSYHATCGLPKTYFTSGPCKWRDTLTPFQLLAKYCTFTGKELWLDKGKPEIINVGEIPYSLSDFESEPPSNPDEVGDALQRLALHVLHSRGLVPEHVETRPLFSKVRPNMEQGKLEMWVDIFSEEDEEFTSSKYDPSSFGADHADSSQLFSIVKKPLHSRQERQKQDRVVKYSTELGLVLKDPVSIIPRQSSKYELRVVIWNTTDVFLQDQSIWGEKMSDIFVRAWIVDMENEQNTSVHERSLDGNGSFNYRMVFPFEYLPIDKKIVIKEKVHRLSRHWKHEHISPIFKVQILDKNRLIRSGLIGDLELDLSHLVRPCVEPSHCGGTKDPRTHNQFVDLFIQKWIFGWWACRNDEEEIKGKVQMTLEILNEEEAEGYRVGLGQSEPNQYPKLDKPIRPAHSFLWYLSPLKTLRWIVWKNFKGTIIKWLIIILMILIIFLFVYSVPNYAAKKALGA